ncbi:YT521-B-like domain-domain-containing protein [Phakopsora pachyrhizi]|uniref:YT521-B-like domain-domain-containing protein n=1 Tax=Phakopsora pachyrhizi TaxID=170000 RepID=A0AAV0BMA5_PHAPC|nr:YT521-B-like domain-domain-containing protein [Phakopsora pachyrhizi]
MKSNGKWGICVLTGPTPNSGQQSLSAQPKDLALARLDAFYELSSQIVGPSTGILPTKTLCDHLSSTGNTISLSKKPTRSVTPIGSPASVSTFAANPWSPSLEERRKLREPILRQASLDTLASAESMSPRKTKNSNSEAAQLMCSSNNESGSEDLQMLHTNFNRINVTSGKGGSEDSNSRPAIGAQSHRMYGTRSPLSNSTSIADLTENLSPDSDGDPKTNPTSASSNKKVPLPPLVTNFSRQTSSPVSVGKSQTQNSAGPTRNSSDEGPLPFRGPASAAAYVPPIGHSLSRNINDPFNLKGKLAFAASHNTAAPGITASNWLSQKERFVGSSLGRSQFNSEWSPAIDTSGVSQLPSATSLGNLPQQIQQQFIIGQQLQQLQQLQAQQQLLQQHQAQILTRALGIPPSLPSALPSSAYNPQTLSGSNLIGSSYSSVSSQPPTLVAAPGYNLSPTPASRSGDAVSSPANSNMIATPPPNPSRLQTTITGLPGLTTNFNGVSPRVISNSLDGGGSLLNFTNSVSGSYVKPIVDATHGQATPISADVQELARLKGYNPAQFNLQPKNARFFVIKSYTEEDVHKSLKYEIWASTTLGNRRLDRAFNESSELGPIYLLFSVNGSGHFCGMAEMMTAVDYNTTSKVWAQDKWKGIFKVRWIFVKDIPNNSLRHIKLTNTPENKPVTSSRDTQEVPYEKGVQILQIMSSFQSRTSLLQDYAWYEHNESHKVNQQDNGQFINLSTAISQKLGSDMINSSN